MYLNIIKGNEIRRGKKYAVCLLSVMRVPDWEWNGTTAITFSSLIHTLWAKGRRRIQVFVKGIDWVKAMLEILDVYVVWIRLLASLSERRQKLHPEPLKKETLILHMPVNVQWTVVTLWNLSVRERWRFSTMLQFEMNLKKEHVGF